MWRSFQRALLVSALIGADATSTAPSASAQTNVGELQSSCITAAQSLANRMFAADPWEVAAAVQQAVPQLQQLLQSASLQSSISSDFPRLGTITGAPSPAATVTPNDSNYDGLTSCTYETTTNFQRGTALVKLVLVNRDSQWQLVDFGMHD